MSTSSVGKAGRADALLRRLAEIEGEKRALREQNPLQFVRLYDKQLAYCRTRARTKMFAGGNGAGKSHVGTIDDLIQLVDRDCLPAHLQELKRWEPPFFMRVVVPKMANIDGVALEKFRELAPRGQLLGGKFDGNGGAYDRVNRKLRFKNGSHVLFNTADQDRDAHAGVRLHRVRFDEEPEGDHGRGIYVENVMRLRDFQPNVSVAFTMTPLFGMSWTYDEIYLRSPQGGGDDDDHFVVVASMLDNVFLPDRAAMLQQVEHLPERERQAIIEGRFVNFHGHVLENFDEERHVVDPPSPQHVQQLETLVGFDPGVARGGVVWVGFDRDNTALVFDELYPKNMSVPEIVEAIRAKNKAWGIDPLSYVVDPSARNRSLTNAESVSSLLMLEGIFPIPGQNDRQAGVLQMRARLERDALLVSRDCVDWRKEQNRWLVAEDEESGKGAASGFKTKGPDHLMDPLRYILMERLWHGGSHAEAPKENPLGLPLAYDPSRPDPLPTSDDLTDSGPLGPFS